MSTGALFFFAKFLAILSWLYGCPGPGWVLVCTVSWFPDICLLRPFSKCQQLPTYESTSNTTRRTGALQIRSGSQACHAGTAWYSLCQAVWFEAEVKFEYKYTGYIPGIRISTGCTEKINLWNFLGLNCFLGIKIRCTKIQTDIKGIDWSTLNCHNALAFQFTPPTHVYLL